MQPPKALKNHQNAEGLRSISPKKQEKEKPSPSAVSVAVLPETNDTRIRSVDLANITIVSPTSLAAVNLVINIACLLAHAALRVWALHRALDRAAADEDGSGAAAHGLALLLQSALSGVIRLRSVCFFVVRGVGVGFPVLAAGTGVQDGGAIAGLAGGWCAGVVYAAAGGA